MSQRGRDKKHIFVFVHYPPKGLAEYIPASLPREDEFFSLLEGYRDVTCFFGDFHGYWRGQRNGVNLIVTGGGGRLKEFRLKDLSRTGGHFNHILRVSVDANKVSEELLTVRDGHSSQAEGPRRRICGNGIFSTSSPSFRATPGFFMVSSGLFALSAIYSCILLAGSFIPPGPSKARLKGPSPVFDAGKS